MNEVSLLTKSVEETTALGEYFGRLAEKDLFIALSGDLGAGKTHFVQGLAKGMGISETVTSPTFTILNYYDGNLPLKHFDFYRLDDEEDLYNIGWEEYSIGGVIVAEWADRFPGLIPVDAFWIDIKRTGETDREISISWDDRAPETVAKEIEAYAACH